MFRFAIDVDDIDFREHVNSLSDDSGIKKIYLEYISELEKLAEKYAIDSNT